MKHFCKTTGVVVMIMPLLMLSSCGFGDAISAREARQQLNAFDMEAMADEIMVAVKAKDVDALRDMMGANIVDNVTNLDTEAMRLLGYYKGDIIYFEYSDAGEQWTKDNKHYRIRKHMRIDFYTEAGSYTIGVDYEVVNTYSEKDIGISFLSISNLDTYEKGPSIKAPLSFPETMEKDVG
jgi:hypothetical protein